VKTIAAADASEPPEETPIPERRFGLLPRRDR
jgi:hypothetical protein